MADGVKALWSRPYIDKNRVGIFGTSYGGYTSVMEILRHPEVFAAASSSSPPTDWRNYDTIYTERYMWIPQENKDGYDKGSAMTYVDNLRGRLMLYYGTADNNVHPTNMMQLIQALQRAGKSFDVQVGPDQGHSGLNQQRMMEFFIENLVIDSGRPKAYNIAHEPDDAACSPAKQIADVLERARRHARRHRSRQHDRPVAGGDRAARDGRDSCASAAKAKPGRSPPACTSAARRRS